MRFLVRPPSDALVHALSEHPDKGSIDPELARHQHAGYVSALRGAGLPSRCYAWLTMLVLLAAAAGADTVHATNTKLPHKPAAAAGLFVKRAA